MDLEQEHFTKVMQLLKEFEVDKVFQINNFNKEETGEVAGEDTVKGAKKGEEKETMIELAWNSNINSMIEKSKIREVDETTNVVEPGRTEEKVTEPLEEEERVKYFMETKDRSEHNSEDEEKIVHERLEELAVKKEKNNEEFAISIFCLLAAYQYNVLVLPNSLRGPHWPG